MSPSQEAQALASFSKATNRSKLENEFNDIIDEHYDCDGGPEVAHIIADVFEREYKRWENKRDQESKNIMVFRGDAAIKFKQVLKGNKNVNR